MKKYISSFLLIVSSFTCSYAQNIPAGTDLTLYPAPSLITLPTGYNQGTNSGTTLAGLTTPILNYSRVFKPQLPSTSISNLDLNVSNNVTVVTKYVNGWGSPIQTNLRGALKDLITVNDYRASSHDYSYLPFTANHNTKFIFDPFADQRNYYNSTYNVEGGVSYSDVEMPLDQSTPTQKVRQPGKAYAGQGVGTTVTTTFNVANEVPRFEKGSGIDDIPYLYGYYQENQIKIVTTEDPEGGIIKEYYNKGNQLLCKSVKESATNWIKTYYLYDYQGKIMVIMPPKAVNTSNVVTLNECYRYYYDGDGNVEKKYTPGMAVGTFNEFKYDNRRRQILYRSPAMKDEGKWSFTIYDDLNRVVAEGILNFTGDDASLHNYLYSNNPPAPALGYYFGNPPENLVTITDCDVLVFNTYDGRRIIPGFTMPDVFNTSHASLYRTDAGAIPPTPYKLYQGLLTGSAVKVVDASVTGNNLGSNYTITQYDYDRKGQVIQTRATSPWYDLATFKTITTFQYNFSGKMILKITDENGPNMATNNSKPYTRMQNAWYYDLDNGGRLTSVKQKMDSEDWRIIANYNYDELGRVSRKMLGGVEGQNYSYDMRGSLSAINKSYVDIGLPYSTDIPARFGVKIQNEYGFSMPRRDGKASGIVWRGAGMSPKHAYGYEYDKVGRLTHAEFREYSSSTYISQYSQTGPIYDQGLNWNKQHKDYTATNMTYDINGNMKSMIQVGVPLGYDHPVYIDVMKYFYGAGNRQYATVDAIEYNYHLDEFVDGTCLYTPPPPEDELEPPYANKGDGDETTIDPYFELGEPPVPPSSPECNDYEYDKNGNLTYDGNKWMSLTYNHMNLPVDITVLNGSGNNNNQSSTIHNVYDGSGALLRKVIKDYNVDPPKIDEYDYSGVFTYRNDSLLDVVHEEGKARYIAPSALFTYDYFAKDHLGNVRAVINAQPADGVTHVATYELASANLESSIFANMSGSNGPNPAPGPANTRAAKLNGLYDSTRTGASILLRVMPEDQLEISALYYWEEDTVTHTSTTSQDMLGSLLGALTGGVGGYSGNEGPDGNLLNSLLNGRNYGTAFGAIKDEITDPNLPRAYLNYMVFDRNMNLVSEQSGALQVGSVTGNWTLLEPDQPLTLGQDGYVLVSVDNAWDMDVHFDQVKVTFYKGMIKQEQHYYPYGLAINAAQDATIEPNQNKYQGKELQDELNVQLYDFHARQYDPQIGKFWGLDPLDQFPSGYTGMGNDPANMVDPTGMQTIAAGRAWALNPGCVWSEEGQTYVPGNVEVHEPVDKNPAGNLSLEMERMMNEEIDRTQEERRDQIEKEKTKSGKWDSYDASIDISTYNCAGLAFRTYEDLNPDDFMQFLIDNNQMQGSEGDIKMYLWEYSSVVSDRRGRKENIEYQSDYDFHMVGAPLGPNGQELDNFNSKDGYRPVYGPGKSSDWIPSNKEPVKDNNGNETPIYNDAGKKLFWHRTPIGQPKIFIIPADKIKKFKK